MTHWEWKSRTMSLLVLENFIGFFNQLVERDWLRPLDLFFTGDFRGVEWMPDVFMLFRILFNEGSGHDFLERGVLSNLSLKL